MEELTLKKPRRIRGRGGGLDCGDPSRHRCQPFPLSPSPYPAAHPTPESRRRGRLLLFLIVLVSAAAALAYLSFPSALTPPRPAVRADADCCGGTQGLELWGPAVKWGSNHRLPSAAACCASCKAMCLHAEDGACRCNSWVFCGDERRCKDRLGEVSPSVRLKFSVPLLHLPICHCQR